MARPLRIEFPGALYHVTSRGNARAPIFLDDARPPPAPAHPERRRRTLPLGLPRLLPHDEPLPPARRDARGESLAGHAAAERAVHPAIQPRATSASGTSCRGASRAVLVERDAHLLELARYVVLNPVRAGLVAAAEDYPWSSLRATLGLAPAPAWLRPGALLARFGSRARYLEFVREGRGAGLTLDRASRGGARDRTSSSSASRAVSTPTAARREFPRTGAPGPPRAPRGASSPRR